MTGEQKISKLIQLRRVEKKFVLLFQSMPLNKNQNDFIFQELDL